MKYIKVVFGILCYAILGISALISILDFVGRFIKEGEIKGLVSIAILFIVVWGVESFNSTWKHYRR
jgi:hypothetical protein